LELEFELALLAGFELELLLEFEFWLELELVLWLELWFEPALPLWLESVETLLPWFFAAETPRDSCGAGALATPGLDWSGIKTAASSP
jgi:hypothetical protein